MKWFDRAKKIMKDKGITQDDLIAYLGVKTRGAVGHYLTGRREPNAEQLTALAKKLDCSLDWLVTGQSEQKPTNHIKEQPSSYVMGSFDVWDSKTPLRDDEVELPFFREVELSAGNGRHEVIENHGFKLRFSKSTLKRQGVDAKYAACVTVAGESMEPVLPNGCVVGIDTHNTVIKNGDMYAIDHQGELRVKSLYRLVGDGIRLRSYNEEYPDEMYNQEEAKTIKILGRVFWCSWLI